MLDYNSEYKNRLKQNVRNVIDELGSDGMKLKISNWANKFEYTFDAVLEKIEKDEMFRCVFAKDPSTQNFYQTLAAQYIESLQHVREFKVLPVGGSEALYLVNGKLLTGEALGKSAKDTKSIDFTWKTGKYTIYASHKYTKTSGGAQDNQYIDVQNFLKNAFDNNQKDAKFVAICDGDYYLGKDASTGYESKLERLRNLTGNNSFAFTINQIPEFLATLA
ncbi:MAG: hypothetical protein LBL52_00825 [Rickettsiales bacterium]|jgi:hypothetical protein|nr:hypothetical protein [Rickettsiales bacterium]